MFHYLKTLAKRFHAWGYSIHESVMLAAEDVDPYRELKLALVNPNRKPRRKYQLNSKL